MSSQLLKGDRKYWGKLLNSFRDVSDKFVVLDIRKTESSPIHCPTATTIIQYPPPQPPSRTSQSTTPINITVCHELFSKVPKKQLIWYLPCILPNGISRCGVNCHEPLLKKSKPSAGEIWTAYYVKTLFNAGSRVRYFYFVRVGWI